MDRREKVLSLFDTSGFGLEIGPSYNPLLPKAEGYHVETLDYADQATLREKYAKTPDIDPVKIEPVDHVSDGRPMVEVIGKRGSYDFIVASHVIEHTPDMIGFLKDCEALLKPDGVLVLAVPDKRCCFDALMSLTSTGEVIEAHRQGRTRPGYGSIFNAVSYGVTRDHRIGWSKEADGPLELFQSLQQAYAIAKSSQEKTAYVDVHVWRFVPSSFELIINDLFEGGMIPLAIRSMDVSEEMLVVLDRTGSKARRSRLAMAEAAIEEQAVSSRLYGQAKARGEESTLSQAKTEEDLALARGEMGGIAADLAESRDRCRLLASDLQAAQQQIALLTGSRSWKLTAPLRRLSSVLGSKKPGPNAS